MRLLVVIALVAGCGTNGDPSPPFCEDLGCIAKGSIACTDQGACSCDGISCVADKPHVCVVDDPHGACETMLGRGWIDYACNTDWIDPPEMTCLTADRIGVGWVGVRCCKPTL